MDFINLKSLNLTAEESEDLIKLLAQKRGITTKKLLSTIKLNLKRKNNKDLPSKSQQKLIKSIKSQQKQLAKTQLELIKSQQKFIKSIKKQQNLTKQTKSQRELIKSQGELKIRNSFYNIDKKLIILILMSIKKLIILTLMLIKKLIILILMLILMLIILIMKIL